MTFQLVCIEPKELTQYKSDMQKAFQKGFEDAFGKTDAVILPEKDIDQSLNAEGVHLIFVGVIDQKACHPSFLLLAAAGVGALGLQSIPCFKKELRMNEVYYMLNKALC